MTKKHYKRRLNKITVRACDNPNEYARQYYHIAIKGEKRAPRRMRRRKQKK